MQTKTPPNATDRPYRLRGFPDTYPTLSEARQMAGIRQCQGHQGSIPILKNDRVVDLKRW